MVFSFHSFNIICISMVFSPYLCAQHACFQRCWCHLSVTFASVCLLPFLFCSIFILHSLGKIIFKLASAHSIDFMHYLKNPTQILIYAQLKWKILIFLYLRKQNRTDLGATMDGFFFFVKSHYNFEQWIFLSLSLSL